MGGHAAIREQKRHGGARDALEMLERCHQKVAERIELLVDAAVRWAETRDRTALEDATDVARFLAKAGRRHELDEEESIFPRLPDDARLADVVRVLIAEHRDHDREGAVLSGLVAEPGGPDPEALKICAGRLASAYRAHIALEDAELTPAVRALPEPVLAEIYAEMQARRGR